MLESQQDCAWSWVVLFCALCCQFIGGGICLSGGLFFVIFTNAFSSDPVETSWLCSLPYTLSHLSSPLGSILTNRYGCRVCSFIGGILAVSGLCLSYLATNLTFLFVTYGFLTGLGLGINYTGCISALNMYFDRYKVLATGIASAGINIGLVVYAEFILVLDNHYSWRGVFLLLGGVTFNLFACATAMMPFKTLQSKDSYHSSTENESSEVKVKKNKKKSFKFSVFKQLSFICLCANNLFFSLSVGIYILHLPPYSQDVGFTQNDIGRVLTVYSICNVVGKVFFSFFGQHPKVNVTVAYTLTLAAGGASMGLTPVFLSRTGMLILAGLSGFFVSVTGALHNGIIYEIVGFSRFTDGLGMSLPFRATGVLIGGPVAGVLLETTGNYACSFYLAGICMVTSSILMIYPIVHIKHEKMKNKHTVCGKDDEVSIIKTSNKGIPKRQSAREKLIEMPSKVIDIDVILERRNV